MNKKMMLQVATKLSKSEMKSVKGGTSQCPPGEHLYTYTVACEGGDSFSGLACGRGTMAVTDRVLADHDIDGGVSVRCVL